MSVGCGGRSGLGVNGGVAALDAFDLAAFLPAPPEPGDAVPEDLVDGRVRFQAVGLAALEDIEDVFFGGGEIDGLDEGGGDGAGEVTGPAAGVGAAGVVFGQAEDLGLVGFGPAGDGAGEIPTAGEDVGAGIEEVGGAKIGNVFGFGPLARGGFTDLHEAALADEADGLGVEPAFAPDDGADEVGIEVVAAGGFGNGAFEAEVFFLLGATPEEGDGEEEGRRQQDEEVINPVAAAHGGMITGLAAGASATGACRNGQRHQNAAMSECAVEVEPKAGPDPRARSWWWCCRLCRVVLGTVGRIEVLGRRELPAGPLVLACNHISHFDPPVVGSRFNRKVDFMAMEDLFRAGWARWMLEGWMDAFPVRRGRVDAGAVREAVRRLRAGRVVGVFAEGGLRTGEASVLGGAAMPSGAAVLARMGGAPVLPVVVMGTDQLYAWRNWLRRPRIYVAVGELLPVGAGVTDGEMSAGLAAAWRGLAECIRRQPGFVAALEPRTAQERWRAGR